MKSTKDSKEVQIKRPLVLAINGCPGVGKTTLALELATRLHIDTIIQTDVLKAVFKSFDSSSIACGNSHDVWKFLGEKNKANIIRAFEMHTHEYQNLLNKIIESYVSRGVSVIIEGVQITPEIFSLFDCPNKVGVYLKLLSKEIQFERFDLKNKLRAKHHPQWYENYDCIELIDEYLLKQAKARNFFIANNYGEMENLVTLVIEEIKNGKRNKK